MYLRSVLQMASLMLHFRNGTELVQRMRAGELCDEVVLWDGTRISHPPGRGGLLEVVVELWLEHAYTGEFYRPADGDVIIDAGANVGLFAIYLARQNPHCRVIALEPFAENFQYLEANVARTRLRNVTCCEVALGATFGKGQMRTASSRSLDHVLWVDPEAKDGVTVTPLSGLFDLCGGKPVCDRSVRDKSVGDESIGANQTWAITESAVPGEIAEIDFLKVDIEGSEHDVFAAATPELLRRFKRIAMEYHDQIVPGTLDMLRRVLTRTHEIEVRPSTMEGSGILLARRQDLKK